MNAYYEEIFGKKKEEEPDEYEEKSEPEVETDNQGSGFNNDVGKAIREGTFFEECEKRDDRNLYNPELDDDYDDPAFEEEPTDFEETSMI